MDEIPVWQMATRGSITIAQAVSQVDFLLLYITPFQFVCPASSLLHSRRHTCRASLRGALLLELQAVVALIPSLVSLRQAGSSQHKPGLGRRHAL